MTTIEEIKRLLPGASVRLRCPGNWFAQLSEHNHLDIQEVSWGWMVRGDVLGAIGRGDEIEEAIAYYLTEARKSHAEHEKKLTEVESCFAGGQPAENKSDESPIHCVSCGEAYDRSGYRSVCETCCAAVDFEQCTAQSCEDCKGPAKTTGDTRCTTS